MRVRALLLAAAALAAAGCAAPPSASGVFRASGTDPVVFLGYDYEGATATASFGNVTLEVDAERDVGAFVAEFALALPGELDFRVDVGAPGSPSESVGRAAAAGLARVAFLEFVEDKPFQNGGIRHGFPEHGATGNGDTLLPQIHALSAGWGRGTLTLDGAPFPDPATGGNVFLLHYMVTDTGPRDPVTNKVTKSDGRTPYDPATPSDGRASHGNQILLNVEGAPMPDDRLLEYRWGGGAASQFDHNESVVLDAPARLALQVASRPAGPAGVASGTFEILDAEGRLLARVSFGPTETGVRQTFVSVPPGAYAVRAHGQTANAHFEGRLLVDHPERFFLHVVYRRATWES
ncbi:MAG TPA: hypothetical protein VM681_01055 [Candidatus Thermoplasmatota archaeon]|nr:hypothetical protein [Candidatus Thermoplasmatota archaeon]